jgi:glutathione S-transferase
MVRLYCFGESGNAYKAALALEMAGINWEPTFVDFFAGEARSEEFRKINPMGEIPVLDTGSEILTQSGVIQDWVIEQTGKLGGSTPTERREIWRWVIFDNQKVSGMAGPLRFMMNFLAEKKRNADVNGFLKGRMIASLQILNGELETRDWLVGDGPTVADLSCAGYLYYPEPFGFDRTNFPAVDAWLTRLSQAPDWKHPYDLLPAPTVGTDNRS